MYSQGRIRLRARWAIAQGPLLSRGPKREKSVRKSIIKGLRGPQDILAQDPQNRLAQGPEDP